MSRLGVSRGFRGRRLVADAGKVRADWVAAPPLVRALAAEAAGAIEGTGTFRQRLTQLSLTLRDLTADNFPVTAPSARLMAGAFLALARNFAHPAWTPEARTACAPFLGAGAECVDQLIAQLRADEAQAGRRVLPREDD